MGGPSARVGALALAAAMALLAAADAGASVYVANPRADAELEPIAAGFAQ